MSEDKNSVVNALARETMAGIWASETVEQAGQMVAASFEKAKELTQDEQILNSMALTFRGFLNAFALKLKENKDAHSEGWVEGFVVAIGATQMTVTTANTKEEYVIAYNAMVQTVNTRLASRDGVNIPKLVGDAVAAASAAVVQSRIHN